MKIQHLCNLYLECIWNYLDVSLIESEDDQTVISVYLMFVLC